MRTAKPFRRSASLLRPAVAMLTLLLAALAPAPAAAQERHIDFSEFHEALAPYGRWIDHPRWGYVWAPDAAEDEDWRPYSRGYWARTEEHGWHWVSDEPWGWATYHYGRWTPDEQLGWIWIPGSEWAPAWVAWRHSDEYVGWAPLPPEAVWEPGGDVLIFHHEYYEQPRFAPIWIFVHPRYMMTSGLHRYAVPRRRNIVIIGRTRHITHYERVNRRIFNRGVGPGEVERLTRRPVPIARIVPSDQPGGRGVRRDSLGAVHIYRPQLAPSSTPVRPRVVTPGDPAAIGRPPGPRNSIRSRLDEDRAPDRLPPRSFAPGSPPTVRQGPPPGLHSREPGGQPPPAAVRSIAPPSDGPPPHPRLRRLNPDGPPPGQPPSAFSKGAPPPQVRTIPPPAAQPRPIPQGQTPETRVPQKHERRPGQPQPQDAQQPGQVIR